MRKEFFKRKAEDNRWDEPEWYIRYIWKCHLKYGRLQDSIALVLDGAESFDKNRIVQFVTAT